MDNENENWRSSSTIKGGVTIKYTPSLNSPLPALTRKQGVRISWLSIKRKLKYYWRNYPIPETIAGTLLLSLPAVFGILFILSFEWYRVILLVKELEDSYDG